MFAQCAQARTKFVRRIRRYIHAVQPSQPYLVIVLSHSLALDVLFGGVLPSPLGTFANHWNAHRGGCRCVGTPRSGAVARAELEQREGITNRPLHPYRLLGLRKQRGNTV